MKLPHYETAFNKEAEIGELSDSSFEENARALIGGYSRFLPSLGAHLANIDNLTPAELSAYNDNVAQILYGPRVLDLFKSGRHKEINDLSGTVKEKLLRPKNELLESIDFNNLAMVLVRPEGRFLTEEVKKFLRGNGYEIVLEHPLVVNLQQYWVMYNEGFVKSDLPDFPTRTLIYTHGESKVFILRKAEPDLQRHLNTELKGSAGIPSEKPTLRGTVILDGFEKAKLQNEKLFYDSIDPLGMYRAITSGKIDSSDPYDKCEDPVFYFAGQGVHLPDGHELATNSGVLLNDQQLEKLSSRFKRS